VQWLQEEEFGHGLVMGAFCRSHCFGCADEIEHGVDLFGTCGLGG